MIRQIINSKSSLFWTAFHVVLGVLSIYNKLFIIIWFYVVFLNEFSNILNIKKDFNVHLNYLIIYLASFEILCRMSRTTPIIPYEISKYLLCALFLFGIFQKFNKGTIGWVLLGLLLPAVFYDSSGEATFENLVFNVMGGVDLALGVVYFRGQYINRNQFLNMLKLGMYPLIAVLSYAFIKTPEYEQIDFTLSANFDTSGGFGSNQVSTALGLGIFLIVLQLLSGRKISGNRILDFIFIIGFAFQGFLTFSRGGMTGSGLAILTTLFWVTFSGSKSQTHTSFSIPKLGLYIIPLLIIGLLVFQTVDDISGNKLSLRYQGETAGTLAGSKDYDLNSFTSNRYNIFMSDIELWQEDVFFGKGVGASAYLRESVDDTATAAHVELSRLLAEHGLLGLFYFIILLTLPIYTFRNNNDGFFRALLIGCFVIGIYSSFHSAMRTFVTPLLISVSQLTIADKQIKMKKKPITKLKFIIK